MIGFDDIDGTVDEYFKIYQLNIRDRLSKPEADELLKYMLDKADAGTSAHEAVKQLLPTYKDPKFLKTILKELEKMYD